MVYVALLENSAFPCATPPPYALLGAFALGGGGRYQRSWREIKMTMTVDLG